MSAKDGSDEQSDVVAAVQQGYAFDGPALELGALVVDGTAQPDAAVRIPLAMVNRHGLVAGATGTGKTKTLAADGRAALRGRRAGVRGRHQG